MQEALPRNPTVPAEVTARQSMTLPSAAPPSHGSLSLPMAAGLRRPVPETVDRVGTALNGRPWKPVAKGLPHTGGRSSFEEILAAAAAAAAVAKTGRLAPDGPNNGHEIARSGSGSPAEHSSFGSWLNFWARVNQKSVVEPDSEAHRKGLANGLQESPDGRIACIDSTRVWRSPLLRDSATARQSKVRELS